MKNSLEGLTTDLMRKKKTGHLKSLSLQGKTNLKKWREHKDLWENIKWTHYEPPRRKDREKKGAQSLFKEIMTKTFQIFLKKEIDLEIQHARWTPTMKNQ